MQKKCGYDNNLIQHPMKDKREKWVAVTRGAMEEESKQK